MWPQSAQPRGVECQAPEEKKPAGARRRQEHHFLGPHQGTHTHIQRQHLCLPTAVLTWRRSTASGVGLPGFECLFCHFLVVLSGPITYVH